MSTLPGSLQPLSGELLFRVLDSNPDQVRDHLSTECLQGMRVFATNPDSGNLTLQESYDKYILYRADLTTAEWQLLYNLASLGLLQGQDRYRVWVGLRTRDLPPSVFNTLLLDSYTGQWSESSLGALFSLLLQ